MPDRCDLSGVGEGHPSSPLTFPPRSAVCWQFPALTFSLGCFTFPEVAGDDSCSFDPDGDDDHHPPAVTGGPQTAVSSHGCLFKGSFPGKNSLLSHHRAEFKQLLRLSFIHSPHGPCQSCHCLTSTATCISCFLHY